MCLIFDLRAFKDCLFAIRVPGRLWVQCIMSYVGLPAKETI